jgi:hypothetical protein
LIDHDITAPEEDPRMTRLKTKVSQNDYYVEADLVAEEILRKVKLIRMVRRQLANGSGRTPQVKLRGL